MRILILLILTLPAFYAQSQGNGTVRGKLVDSTSAQPVTEATISLLQAHDSSFVNYAIAGKQGEFGISNLAAGNYLLVISCRGYSDLKKVVSVGPGTTPLQLGNLFLSKEYITLSEAVVSSQAAVKMKGDTVAFMMDAFKTSPGATLEEGLKKLPGLQVQKDGTIRAMGEVVQKLYVDGKEFFANDPSVAARNLTADMVEQVQVFDELSEQAKFTRMDDGSRAKSLNIKLKKNRKKGDFGKLVAGTGTHQRYESQLSANHFSDVQRITLVGAASNTNKYAYQFGNPGGGGSATQFSNGSGPNSAGSAGRGSAAGGINESASAGINYTDQWGARMDFRTSYQFSSNHNRLDQNSFKKYSFPADSFSTTTTGSAADHSNNSHRVTARWEYTIDSSHSVLYTANLSVQQAGLLQHDSAFTLSQGIYPYLAITGTNQKNDNREASAYGGELLYRQRFRLPGQTFTLAWKNSYSGNASLSFLQSLIRTYDRTGNPAGLIDPDQQNWMENNSRNNTISASFTQPAGLNKLLEFNYSYSAGKNKADIKTYDLDPQSGRYDKVNLYQTNYFDFTQVSSRAGANFRLIKKAYNYQLGAALQRTESSARSIQARTGKDTLIRQRFTNFFPVAGFSYTISRNAGIRFYYRGRTNMPAITQLQDVQDISNPLQVRTGNPGLKQEFISNYNLHYNSFNLRSSVFFNASINVTTTGNKIVNSIDSLQTAVIIIRPENQNGSYNGSAVMNIGWPLKKLKGASLNFASMAFLNREASLLFKKKNFNAIFVLDQAAGFSYSTERFDLGLNGSLVYHSLAYALQPDANTSYFRTGWSGDFTYRFKHDFFILTNLEQTSHTGRSKDFNRNILLWNMAVARKFLKNKSAEIKLTAYDLFKQDKGINRVAGDNYFEDTRVVVTPRFFLLSFTYSFKNEGKKKKGGQQEPPKPAAEKMMIFSN